MEPINLDPGKCNEVVATPPAFQDWHRLKGYGKDGSYCRQHGAKHPEKKGEIDG